MLETRIATDADLDGIAALSRRQRDRLSAWSPRWWNKADGADEIHPLWLQHLINSDGPVVTVAVEDDVVVGVTVQVPQPGTTFVDDVAVIDEDRWSDVGTVLLGLIDSRPAVTCVAPQDTSATDTMNSVGLVRVSSYYVGPIEVGDVVETADVGDELPPSPTHSFTGAVNPAVEGSVSFAALGGVVVGSAPVPPPPIYDPGGSVVVIDRVVGPDRAGLLAAAGTIAAEAGAVLICVVVGIDDEELATVAEAAGLTRAVDVYAW